MVWSDATECAPGLVRVKPYNSEYEQTQGFANTDAMLFYYRPQEGEAMFVPAGKYMALSSFRQWKDPQGGYGILQSHQDGLRHDHYYSVWANMAPAYIGDKLPSGNTIEMMKMLIDIMDVEVCPR